MRAAFIGHRRYVRLAKLVRALDGKLYWVYARTTGKSIQPHWLVINRSLEAKAQRLKTEDGPRYFYDPFQEGDLRAPTD